MKVRALVDVSQTVSVLSMRNYLRVINLKEGSMFFFMKFGMCCQKIGGLSFWMKPQLIIMPSKVQA
jgi:hypothetical protein